MLFAGDKVLGLFLGLLIVLSFISTVHVSAIMIPLSINELTNNADAIIIGNVTDTRSDWVNNNTTIQTWVIVSVNDVLKGNLTKNDSITILTEGGVVGNYQLWVEDEPSFTTGQLYGIFLRQTNSSDYQVEGSYQGVIGLVGEAPPNPQKGEATVTLIEEFKDKIYSIINETGFYRFSSTTSSRNDYYDNQATFSSNPIITSVTPNIASAGTNTQIIIKGSGFGTKSSRQSYADVRFFFQDDGLKKHYIYASGFCYNLPDWELINDYDIISWTDTQIITKVPTGFVYDGSRPYPGGVSSGPIYVDTDIYTTSNPYPFTVTFGYSKAKWAGSNPTVNFYVNAPDSNYIQAINKAANTWNSAPSKNFQFHYSGTTSSAGSQKNAKNEIYWGETQSIAVTKTLTNGYLGVYGDVLEKDIIFNNKLNWNFNLPNSNEFDVETITLHEMGHCVGLRDLYGNLPGYSSDQNKIMFGLFDYGEIRRTLSSADITGIQYIYPKSSPTTGSISVQSSPTGAKIFIDGIDTNFVTPKTISNLATGNHTIKCNMTGYDDGSQSVTVIPGQTTSVMITLQKSGNVAPKADFSASPRDGESPLTVRFSDKSTSSPTSWSWSFGDGGTSTEQNPSHTYLRPGIYTVKLKVSNNAGTNGLSKSGYIVVSDSGPTPTITPTTQPTTVATTMITTVPTIIPTTVSTITHTSQPTTFPTTVLTTIITTLPTTPPTTVPTTVIPAAAPKADFSASAREGFSPLTVQFTDKSTSSPTSWLWTFGDGSSSTDQNPTHTYLKAGIYSVKLKVSNSNGSSGLSRSGYIVVSDVQATAATT